MADLPDAESAQSVKIAGATGTGSEANFAGVDTNNQLKVVEPSHGTNNSAAPTVSSLVGGTNGTNIIPLAVDSLGRLITTALTGFNSGFSSGYVGTAALTEVPVNATAYTEQSSNAQRSIVSASANDTAAGTGAHTVALTYYTVTGAGPFTETITMNGTTAVNTVSSTICFIEKLEVMTAGSGLVNAGIISIKAAAAGAGVTVASMLAGDSKTFYAHHYVPVGKSINITGLSCSHSGTTVGSGAVFKIFARTVGVANAANRFVSDIVRLYGQSSTFSRVYQSPINVPGPAFVFVRVTPESASSFQYRASIDFFEP